MEFKLNKTFWKNIINTYDLYFDSVLEYKSDCLFRSPFLERYVIILVLSRLLEEILK